MADIDIHIVSDQRSGLLVDLISTITKHHFALLRQHISYGPQNISLTLTLQGSD